MPPVRWKLSSAVTFVCLLQLVPHIFGQHRQDTNYMTSDGWRPIVGTRKPGYYDFNSDNSDIYKYEVLSTPPPTVTAQTTATTSPSKKGQFRGSPTSSGKPGFDGNKFPGRKIPHQKPNPYYALPTYDTHGPHIPLGAVVHTRPSQIGHVKPHVTSIKPYIQISANGKRHMKPVLRIQTSTNNYRDDIFTASATSGTYTHFKQPTSNIRTRETIDLGLPGTNHYATINQPHAHIEFANRFALPPTSESVFQQYNNPAIPAFIFGKHPQSNDVNYQFTNQNDEFTRLVPPLKEVVKERNQEKGKVHDNVVLQVPPPFQYQSQKVVPEDQVQVQVTKEKIHEFHNNVPPGFDGTYVEYNFPSIRQPTDQPKQVYEVTEGTYEDVPSQRPLRLRKPQNQPKRRPDFHPDIPIFLPTPYKPDGQSGILPTSPTQEEVSTIFTKLSKLQREKAYTTPNPNDFNVKEVSTHYPIFGKPVFANPSTSDELSNDITTEKEEVVTTTKEPQRTRPHRRRRPDARRTTTTTTTTEAPEEVNSYESSKTQENETSQSIETERPVRIRRPNRYRTTTPPNETEEITLKPSRGRNRYRHRNNEENYEGRKRIRTSTTTESEAVASEKSEEIEDNPKAETVELELPGRHYPTEVPVKKIRYETIRPFIVITTTEKTPTTNLVVPENEVDATPTSIEETTTITTTTTTTTPSTTTPSTTVSTHRIKGRPIRFDNSHRPRFSVKDYREKLNQYSSTTTSTTSEPHSNRIRLPSRLRRPFTTTTVTNEEENTEPNRNRFVPKDPRHSVTTEDTNVAIITEKNVKSVNTRLRPFGRKTTTATTTTAPKVSIKPNLFNRKRPPMISLRSKIYNKYRNNNTTTTTTTEETTLEFEETEAPTTTEKSKIEATEETDEDVETTTVDISKSDPFFYSQRVSDLTSSAKNEYNTPGLFKSVAPTSRRIPNYFTIATDDPILPIEAFFPNINGKMREKDT